RGEAASDWHQIDYVTAHKAHTVGTTDYFFFEYITPSQPGHAAELFRSTEATDFASPASSTMRFLHVGSAYAETVVGDDAKFCDPADNTKDCEKYRAAALRVDQWTDADTSCKKA
ncbi:unnamed protein product, partial [Amoebophrya sp. A25]